MDIRFSLTEYYGGLHCGDVFDVKINSKWIPNSLYANGKYPEVESTGMSFGNGWKLDAVQQLKQVELDDTDYMLHIDGDGTYHYYAKEGTVWKDEDGLNLEIKSDKIYGSTGTSYKNGYSITTDKGAELSFYNGLLVQQTDQNGNAIRYHVWYTPQNH